MDLVNPEQILLEEISTMIERTKRTIYTQANRESVLLFWNIGRRVNDDVLQNKRADYGKQIVVSLSRQLTKKYGRSFEEKIYAGCASSPSNLLMRKLSLRCHDN